MNALLEDLLEYSRLGRQEQIEAVDCNTVLSFSMANLSASIRERNAAITCDALPTVQAHTLRLTRVFQNLIHNAIEYCAPERTPAIVIAAHDEHTAWRFSVSDNGIGMRAAHLTRIFEPFKRLHSRHAYPGTGTGIGLAICRRIVEGFGGKLWVESTPGQGSTFHFTLPKQILGASPPTTQDDSI